MRRDHLFEDSHRAIMSLKNKELMKARLWVKFAGETGLDYGGLSRYVCSAVVQPSYALANLSTTQPSHVVSTTSSQTGPAIRANPSP